MLSVSNVVRLAENGSRTALYLPTSRKPLLEAEQASKRLEGYFFSFTQSNRAIYHSASVLRVDAWQLFQCPIEHEIQSLLGLLGHRYL
jgi:hypothetical protein